MRSSQIASALLAALLFVFLATTDVSAQLDTLWQAGALTYSPDGCGGAFVFGGWPVVKYVGRVDSTGTYLWYSEFVPPEWKWQDYGYTQAVLDYSKSAIGVWSVTRSWVDSSYHSHYQYGCAVWKFDSLGQFQWVVSTQLPDSENFIPEIVSVDSNNQIIINGFYNLESCCICEPEHEHGMGIMRISPDGVVSLGYVCGISVSWITHPENPRQPMTYSACYDNEKADSCDGYEVGTFYSHTLYRYANDSIRTLPLDLKDIRLSPEGCGPDYTGYRPVESGEYGQIGVFLEIDSVGNTFEILKEETHIFSPDTYSHRYLVAKYTPSGDLAWMIPLSATIPTNYSPPPTGLTSDHEGGVIVGCMDGIRRFDAGGSFVWYAPIPSEITGSMNYVRVAVDVRNNVYARIWTMVTGQGRLSWFACFDGRSGKQRYVYNMGNDNNGLPLIIDSAGCIYSGLGWGVGRLRQYFSITVRDAKGDSLPEEEFTLIRVAKDPPLYTEDTLGVFTTDTMGVYKFLMVVPDSFLFVENELDADPDTLGVGDLLKVTRRVHDTLNVRHPGLVGTQYSVHLDNLHINEDGAIAFDTVDGEHYKDIVLGHTEYRYNLLVSVEWDAVEAYQEGLQDDFRQMSNYLYDVTDGQLRLDTVAIVDNGELWEEADVRIRASNVHMPDAQTNAITVVGGYPINMPRKWFGDTDPCRWYSYEDHPLDAAVSNDYRAKAHEFGHFALGFFDEYKFMDPLGNPLPAEARCEPRPAGNYGFMDYEYEGDAGGVHASEMSSEYRYERESCQNTRQWVLNGSLSCWDWWESWAEKELSGLPASIRKPDQADTLEHLTPEGLDYIRGPNDNLAVPDYDVGQQIYFANPVAPPDPANRSLNLYVNGVPAGGVEVSLWKNIGAGGLRVIEQGKTRDDGLIWALGGSSSDVIFTSGHSYVIFNLPLAKGAGEIKREWLTGSLDLSTVTGDSASITLRPIEGDYPLVLSVDIAATPQRWRLEFAQPFSELPSLQFLSGSGQPMTPTVAQLADNYDVRPDDTIASEGQARLGAADATGSSFFVPFSYVNYALNDSTQLEKLLGPGAHAILSISSQNSAITKALIVASSYPPILTGLEVDAVQAGDAYATSVAPSVTLTGAINLTILYSDDDLKAGDSLIGDESLLKIYRWDEGGNSWKYVGGLVDTARDEVTAEISELGTFALFTTKSPVGVDDEPESELPYRFELSQNYPNPFNPVTIIEYSVPSRTDITIDIFNVLGQKVRTLVNEAKAAGSYRIEWNGSDEAGNPVSTGVYLYRFQAGEVVQTKKMLLIK